MTTAVLEKPKKRESNFSPVANKIFHLAIPCTNIDETIDWYSKHFGSTVKRKMPTSRGAHLDFYGNQITFVEVDNEKIPNYHGGSFRLLSRNEHGSLLPHFGVVLSVNGWMALKDYLVDQDDVRFDVLPHVKFPHTDSEHYTMFILDPSGNALEIKAFTQTDTWL
jgi:extradiol dioxygenase family protein